MNYATGAAFNLKETFLNFPFNKLKISCDDCKSINGNPHRDILVRQIFRECYKLILNDIIDNNVTFELPITNRKVFINMKRTKGEQFKRARRFGKWEEIDFLSSLFSGYELALTIETNTIPKVKNIYVDKNLKKKIIDNTNLGKQYC